MAEGFLKNKSNFNYEVYSAGIEAHGVNPIAIKVMSEIGIDISNQNSQSISENELFKYNIIVTLCGNAKDRCPILSNQENHIHWGLEDPANAKGTEQEVLDVYREIRDQIKDKINSL